MWEYLPMLPQFFCFLGLFIEKITGVHRKGEALRQVSRSYLVSYEAIRRILAAARRSHAQGEEEP
jgi:hypothetical protein